MKPVSRNETSKNPETKPIAKNHAKSRKKSSGLLAALLLTASHLIIGQTPAHSMEPVQPAPAFEYKIAHNFDLLNSEGFGELKIGLRADEAIQILGEPESKGDQQFWGADGLYHQKWNYPQRGITLDMASETEAGPAVISSIRVKSPSQLTTGRGVGIGDSSAKVKQAYAAEEDESAPISSDYFVAGSVYGGLIFTFENNQVTEMFLGAAAE